MTERRRLNTQLIRRALVVVALISAIIMVAAGGAGSKSFVSAGAALFAFALSIAAVLSNFEAWRLPPIATPRAHAVRSYLAIRINTVLGAIAYGWGAIAMQGLYLTPLTGLKWQHGWQYAMAMALLAGSCIAFVRTLPLPAPARRGETWQWHSALARPLAIAQAAISAGGTHWDGAVWQVCLGAGGLGCQPGLRRLGDRNPGGFDRLTGVAGAGAPQLSQPPAAEG